MSSNVHQIFVFVDVDVDKPDEKSIMTYVAQFLKHYPNPHHFETDGQHDEVFLSGFSDSNAIFTKSSDAEKMLDWVCILV